MAQEFRLPDIGEGIHEGEIVKWLVKAGDHVKEDQPLLEVMTDKVTAEIPSPVTATIQELRGKEGEIIHVGAVIVVFGEAGSAAPVAPAEKSVEKHAVAPVAVAPIERPVAQSANGSVSAAPPVPACATAAIAQAQSVIAAPAAPRGGKVLAAPATRRLAREMGVNLQTLAGSGPRGRVTPHDVRSATGGQAAGSRPAAQHVASVQAKPGHSYAPVATTEGERRVPFSGMRRKIGEHLSLSKHTAPHFAYAEEIDMTELLATRQALKSPAEAHGVKLTFLPFIIKAAIAALKKYPSLNASLDETTQELVYKNVYNIGVATATDSGLVVPVIHNAHQKSILELAQAISSLSEKARTGKLSLDEMRGGTFTLTSIGSVGGLFSVPIINYPEVAIIGINKITPRPVVRNGEIVIRDIMYLSISCDHRVVDGYEAALFVKELQATLEDPRLMLL